MEFEPIDEDLEPMLQEIIDKTDESSGYASDVEYTNPEHRALKELGFFENAREYLDGTALVMLKRKGLKYFDRKKEWEKQRKVDAVKGIGEKAVDKGADIAATVLTKMAGM